MRTTLALSVACLLCGSIAVGWASTAASVQDPVLGGAPPSELWPTGNAPAALFAPPPAATGTFAARAYFSVPRKEVLLVYTYRDAGEARVAATESVAVNSRIWPTAVCDFDETSIIVAGKSAAGKTVLQKWTLDAPQLVTDSVGRRSIRGGARSGESLLYSDDVAGFKLVQAMARAKGGPDRLILLSHDTKELYYFELASQTWSKFASPVQGSASLHEPALAERLWISIEAREHVSDGYVYTLHEGAKHVVNPSDTDYVSLVMRDTDKNGQIDSLATMTVAQWKAAGYSNPSAWADQ